jgi:N-acylglucosamine 2-epimerase
MRQREYLVMDRESERAFYLHHLERVVLPFWLDRAVDTEYGGYLTCFDNTGRELVSNDKFTWSQGRMVWVLAKLASMESILGHSREEYLGLARSGAEFLMQHAVLDNGHCAFVMDRQGNPKEQAPGAGYDTSIYADCFVILGLSRYASTAGDSEALDFARGLYRSVLDRLASGCYRTEPYPTPAGYKAHGIPMIMLNVSEELAQALAALGDPASADVDRRADGYLREIMDHFVAGDLVHETIDTSNRIVPDRLLGRYVNPGHTLEDMWFVMHQALTKDDRDTIAKAARIILRTLEVGWDEAYGGLCLFVDRDGGPPRGSTAGLQDHTMVLKVENDWDNKLWWPHVEGLYATLLAFSLTGDRPLLEWYQKVRDYTFNTFPNPDPEVGEWIQIRDRQGRPQDKIVALPVKDPFHIIRALILMVELLDQRSLHLEG